MLIKAIETEWRGYRFRSRTEARYAIMFDTLNLRWEYEREGFALPGGVYYLPDFWLPDLQTFVEVKGDEPTNDEQKRCILLAKLSGHPVVMFIGVPEIPPLGLGYFQYDGAAFMDGVPVHFYRCRRCARVQIGMALGRQRVVGSGECGCPLRQRGRDKHDDRAAIISQAVYAARAARFEYGEKPA